MPGHAPELTVLLEAVGELPVAGLHAGASQQQGQGEQSRARHGLRTLEGVASKLGGDQGGWGVVSGGTRWGKAGRGEGLEEPWGAEDHGVSPEEW